MEIKSDTCDLKSERHAKLGGEIFDLKFAASLEIRWCLRDTLTSLPFLVPQHTLLNPHTALQEWKSTDFLHISKD